LVYLLAAATSARIRFGRLARTVVVVFLAVVLITSAHHPRVLALAWSPLMLLVPLSVLAAAMTLAHRETAFALNPLHRQQLMLMVTVAALASLIQIPFSAAIYFCYADPLLLLSLLALLSTRPRRFGFLLVTLGAFYLAFVVLRITPSFLHTMGNYYQPDRQSHRLSLYRTGGLRIDPQGGGSLRASYPAGTTTCCRNVLHLLWSRLSGGLLSSRSAKPHTHSAGFARRTCWPHATYAPSH
jgi:hypothetical protein